MQSPETKIILQNTTADRVMKFIKDKTFSYIFEEFIIQEMSYNLEVKEQGNSISLICNYPLVSTETINPGDGKSIRMKLSRLEVPLYNFTDEVIVGSTYENALMMFEVNEWQINTVELQIKYLSIANQYLNPILDEIKNTFGQDIQKETRSQTVERTNQTTEKEQPWMLSKPEKKQRDELIWTLRQEGYKWDSIADKANCGLTTARENYDKMKKIQQNSG